MNTPSARFQSQTKLPRKTPTQREICKKQMVRGRGFEPLNPYGTRSPNIRVDVPELHVRMVWIRLAPLTWLRPLGIRVWRWGAGARFGRGLPPHKPGSYPAREPTVRRPHKVNTPIPAALCVKLFPRQGVMPSHPVNH